MSRFSGRSPIRVRDSHRSAFAGIASVLVCALVIVASTSSVQRPPAAVTTAAVTVIDAPAADVLPGPTRVIAGFAPPAPRLSAPEVVRVLAPALPTGPLGIPGIVLQAYKLAAARIAAENPACKLPWFLLAGIGRIESGHADNGSVDASGTTINPIEGPVLDGTLAGNAVITDTDKGAIDGDATHDRAVGPMQFIPSTWTAWGADANGDGKADPNNIFDATYSAGRYLCSGVTDIMSAQRRVSAVLRYNNSIEYATNVLTWALAYSTNAMPTAGILEPKLPPSTKVSKSVRPPSAAPSSGAPSSGAPASGAPASGRPAKPGSPGETPSSPPARFTQVDKPFTVSGTIAVMSQAGPVSCSVDLTGTVDADGATATVTRATISGRNPLCGLARASGLPWTLTPTDATTVELSDVVVAALGAQCGPATLSGDLSTSLTATEEAHGAACTVRTVTLRPTPSLALS